MLCKISARFFDPVLSVEADVKNNMLLLAESRELLQARDGIVDVPVIEFRHFETQREVFCSRYIREIPVDDFDSFMLNTLRFCFAFGVIMGEKWYCAKDGKYEMDFLVDDVTIYWACELLDWDTDDYEALMVECTDYFIQRLKRNDVRGSELTREVRGALSLAQTFGSALCLKQYNIY